MDRIINNKFNLKEEEMNERTIRVKTLLINSNNEILLGYSHNNYQFPGGHVEKDETFYDALKREVLEETGINIKIDESIEPFACRLSYYKDYPKEGINTKIEIYYYEIRTDEEYNLNNTNYTEHESEGNFILKYIPLESLEEELNKNIEKFKDKHGISKEMIELLSIYKNNIDK